MKTLYRTDKNGTKYYRISETCGKCHGLGRIDYYHFHDGGLCYECNGTGVVEYKEVERTKEYEAVLEKRRDAKYAREAPKSNARLFERMGLSAEGSAFCVKGDTYQIKDELKSAGARYFSGLGWFFPSPVDGWETFEITIDQMASSDRFGKWEMNISKASDAVKKANGDDGVVKSEFVGEVGEKIDLPVKLVGKTGYETMYGWMNVYVFNDDEGNTLVWKTSSFLFEDRGVLKARVKAHSMYNGEKQTELVRCKLS